MRLVDADALLSELEKYNDLSAKYKDDYLYGLQQRLETCIELVEDAPTVDAVPVRHGRWIMHEVQINGYSHAVYECTACGVRVPAAFVPLKYCSNCGAKLDRKDGNADGV